jgi:hypothetical protein
MTRGGFLMAISLKQYLAEADRRDLELGHMETCNDCGVPLQEAIHGFRRVGPLAKCSDCYFNQLSDLIDQAPIGRPMSRVCAA